MSEIYKAGKSGVEYEFRTFQPDASLPDKPGIFYIADSDQNPIFIDRTDNFRRLIGELRMKSEGIDLNVHFHLRHAEVQSSLILEDLKEKWNPPCNDIKNLKQFVS